MGDDLIDLRSPQRCQCFPQASSEAHTAAGPSQCKAPYKRGQPARNCSSYQINHSSAITCSTTCTCENAETLPQQAPSCRVHQQQMVWLDSHQCLQHLTTTLGSHSYSTQWFFVCEFCRWREFAFCTSPLGFGHSVRQIQ